MSNNVTWFRIIRGIIWILLLSLALLPLGAMFLVGWLLDKVFDSPKLMALSVKWTLLTMAYMMLAVE